MKMLIFSLNRQKKITVKIPNIIKILNNLKTKHFSLGEEKLYVEALCQNSGGLKF